MRIEFFHEAINWDFSPNDLDRFLGGTEAWMVELAEGLARRGHRVCVKNDNRASLERNGVFYVWRNAPDSSEPPAEARIYWNHPSSADGLDLSASKNFYWSNGVDPWADDYKDFYESLDAYVAMSRQQISEQQAPIRDKAVVIPGGVNPKEFEFEAPIERKVNQCIYSSSWDRGLDLILASWLYIKRKSPSLSLVITYGGHGKWQDPSKVPLIPDLPDVKVVGGLDRVAMARTLRESEYLLFANREPRSMKRGIYLSALKAQHAGVIPVTTPHCAADEDIYAGIQVPWKDWADTLIALSTNPELKQMAKDRLKEKPVPTWDDVAKQWEELLESKL